MTRYDAYGTGRFCKMDGCGNGLHKDNVSGYCGVHRERRCRRCGSKHRTRKSLCMSCRRGQ